MLNQRPGVFTTLIRKLGVRGLEVTELYGIEPSETDHLNPHGLVFCYLCDDDAGAQGEFGEEDELADPDAREVWFANQLSTDDFAGTLANQTNLAIKGIVGIKAMAQIAQLVGDDARSSNYSVRLVVGLWAQLSAGLMGRS